MPVSALHSGEAVLTYDIKVAWLGKDGEKCSDERQVLQRVFVEPSRGATVPWVHFKVQPQGKGTDEITFRTS